MEKRSASVVAVIVLLTAFMLVELLSVYPLGIAGSAWFFFFGFIVLAWCLAWLFYVVVWGMTSR